MFALSENHLFRSVNVGRYSQVYRDLNMLVISWSASNLRSPFTSISLLLITGVLLDRLPNRK